MNDETEGPPSFWVRAAYDYHSTDDSSLSFSRGDIVEVLGTLPSGWWDGLIGNERGWFPSNFVVTISDAEAEAELAGRGAIDVDPATLDASDSEWVQDELEHPTDAALPDFARDDLWLPEVQPNGQIVYVNGAGQRRTDLPDADTDDMVPPPVAVPSPRPTRPRANTATTQSSLGGFAFIRRTGTPEPWLKRLTDDGHTFFYENTDTGAIMWSRPDASHALSTQQSLASSTSGLDLRSRYRVAEPAPEEDMDPAPSTDEDMPFMVRQPNHRLSVYSDASEVNPRFDIDFPIPAPTNQADTEPHTDPAEVQRRLAPVDPDTIESLASVAKQAINAVSQCMVIPDRTPHAPLVAKVIIAVRNLLYVSGTLAPASEVLSPLIGDSEPRESQPPLAHLKQYQRKVTATLSKLVLSARAADSGEDDANARSRVAIDAGELERAVDRFVAEAHDRPIHRTLRGVFSPAHVGRGAPGGGIGGQWRGSGFVERVPKGLTPEACEQLGVLGGELEAALVGVQQGVASVKETSPNEHGVSTIITRGRAAIATLCAFLNAAEELDVAAKVGKDIETRRGLVRKAVLEQGLARVKSRDELKRMGSKDELRRVGRVGSRDQLRRMGSRDELKRIGSREELGRLSRPASRDKLSRMNSQEQFAPHMSRQPSRDQLAPVPSPLSLSRPGSRDKLTISRSASRDQLAQSPSFSAKRLDTSQGVRNAVRRLEVTKQALYDAGVTLLLASQTVHVVVLRGAGSVPAPDGTRGVDAHALDLVSHSVTTIRENQREMLDLLDALAKTDSPDSYVSAKRDTLMSSNYSQSYRTDTDVVSRTDTYPSSIRSPVDDHLATLYGGDSSIFGDSIYGNEFAVGRDRVDSVGRDSRFDSIGRESRFDSLGMESRFDSIGRQGRSDSVGQEGRFDSIGRDTRLDSISTDVPRGYQKPRQPLKHLDSAVSLPQSDVSEGHYSRSGTALGRSRPDDSLDLLSDQEDDLGSRGPPRVNKIRKLLGDDAAAELAKSGGAIAPTPIVDTTPWYLKPTYNDPSQIQINTDGGVRGGTLPALIERLTMHDQMDSTFIDAFLMTYKSFTTTKELFQLLVERFRIQPPDGLTPAELEDWTERKQKPARVRVVNVFRKMLLLYNSSIIDKEDSYILEHIKSFAQEIVRDVTPAEQLIMFVDRIQKQGDTLGRKYTLTTLTNAPPSILPKQGKRLKLLDIEPLELARQLTLLESKQYNAIKAIECLARARDEPAENDSIKTIITTTNKIASWVAFSVLEKDEPRRRGNTIKHFIHVAEKCRALHNYSSMAALIAGLNSPPIRRLKRTWDSVPAKFTAILDDVEATLDSGRNFTAYKQRLKSVDSPCVPFLGVYLTMLTFIQDGNKDFIDKEKGIINFGKRQKAAEVIREIQSYQAKQYNLSVVDQVQTFIEQSLASIEEKADYWETSMALEPREREDEKMTRMLQESGFL
ncbi:unnamed protein product [Rhizoctonia solani]|uniref:Cell division control protein 25 n=1 Tax=Rhizoctonia solani TaxID=456999 RepID=A0A8H3CVT7_9AGAM|nr:unnamed protein product [Rhizoctonia solani]